MNPMRVLPTLALLAVTAPALAQENPPLPAPASAPPPAATPAPAPAPAPAVTPAPAPAPRPASDRGLLRDERNEDPIDAPPVRPAPAAVDASPEAAPAVYGPRVGGLRVNLGLKWGYVGTSGYDLVSSDNSLPSFTADATYAVLTRGRLALAVGLGLDAGGSFSDELRGIETRFSAGRYYVPIEVRYEVAPWLWGLARVGPGALHVATKVSDPSSPTGELKGGAWAFNVDATLGAAFAIDAGKRKTQKGPPRFLIMPEVGYMVSTPARVSVNPDRDSDEVLGTDESTRLGKVALSGFVWRATLGMAF